MQSAPDTSERKLHSKLIVAFGCVYFFWGSTFLGIHFAVEHFAPPMVSGLRFAMAAPAVFLVAWMRGKRLRVTRTELWQLIVTGLLLLVGGNVFLVWAEKTLDSGFAALVVACIPILMMLLETILPGGQMLPPIGWAGLFLGFAGLVTLLWPTLSAGHAQAGRIFGSMILIFGSFCWALGSVLSKRFRFQMDPFVVSAWQMLVAGIANLSVATLAGQWRTADWAPAGIWAIVYLAIFGSIVGFGSYAYILHHAPVAKVATYAYVNPIVAIVLGATIVHERLKPLEWVGMVIILSAVAVVNTAKMRPARKSSIAAMELPEEG
jgi:drug/metabolite transporter (DMT)-like permease